MAFSSTCLCRFNFLTKILFYRKMFLCATNFVQISTLLINGCGLYRYKPVYLHTKKDLSLTTTRKEI